MAEEAEKPTVNVKFLFNVCNDIDEIRHFYTDIMGMQEQAFMNDENFGYLSYHCDNFDFMFFRAEEKLPVITEWACQPGWAGGTLETTSWGIMMPFEEFKSVYKRMKTQGVPLFKPEPEWRHDSYWGLSVMDPMGNTIEVGAYVKEKPVSTRWPGKE
ncbi:VOC family protein [candidate division WOR-3 bacterium]|nr:VOC family protein [candidate division WOR-3 bacterium]